MTTSEIDEQSEIKNTETYDKKGEAGTYARWHKEIQIVKEGKRQKAFEKYGEKVQKIYRSEPNSEHSYDSVRSCLINLLWSSVQIQLPTYFARLPKVVVERRFRDSDPVARVASMLYERAVTYQMEVQQDRCMHAGKSAVLDMLLPGRGQVWLCYKAGIEEMPAEGEVEKYERIRPNSERVEIEYIYWQDYLESPARNPFESRWRAKRAFMTQNQLVKFFGKIGKEVDLRPYTESKQAGDGTGEEFLMQAEVYEIQDLEGKQTIWITDGLHDKPLKVRPDYYKVEGFYTSPFPLLATTTNDTSYPVPDYKIYEKLADEVEYLSKRISDIVSCIRFVGATSAAFEAKLKDIMKAPDGTLKSLENWPGFTEKQGFAGIIDWIPFEKAAEALPSLREYRQECIDYVQWILATPDLEHGVSDPNETVAAQQKKSHFTNRRTQVRQADVQRFWREIANIMGQITFEPGLFSDETIWLMCNVGGFTPEDQELFPQALELARNDRLATFRLSIETDSTISSDENETREQAIGYMGAVSQLVGNLQSMSEYRPELLKPAIESFKFIMSTFRTGRTVTAAWENALQQIEQNDAAEAEAAAQQPPPPDYEMLKIQNEQAKVQIQGQELQLKSQEMGMNGQMSPKDQAQLQLDSQIAQGEYANAAEKNRIEMMKVSSKAEIDQITNDLELFKEQFKQQVDARVLALETAQTAASIKQGDHDQKLNAIVLAHEQKMNEVDRLHDQMSLVNDKDSIVNDRLKIDKETSEAASVK